MVDHQERLIRATSLSYFHQTLPSLQTKPKYPVCYLKSGLWFWPRWSVGFGEESSCKIRISKRAAGKGKDFGDSTKDYEIRQQFTWLSQGISVSRPLRMHSNEIFPTTRKNSH